MSDAAEAQASRDQDAHPGVMLGVDAALSGLTVSDLIAWCAGREIWRGVVGHSSYAVSSWGNVRRVGSSVCLAPIYGHGYAHADLCEQGVVARHRVHRLVALAFLGAPPFPDALVSHIDGSRDNNRVDNLRWATPTDNQRDRERHATRIRGSVVAGAKLRESQIPVIRDRIASGERYPTIARDFGVSISTISLISKNKIWSHA